MGRARVLILAWLCGPHRGSEWALSWGMVLAVAERYDVTVVTRDESAQAINAWIAATKDRRIRTVAVLDQPGIMSKVGKFLPHGHFFTYLDWLRSAGKVARSITAQGGFAGAVHAALGCYWLPSPVVDLGVPSLWGPLGGATRTPRSLARFLGVRGALDRGFERLVTYVASRLPVTRRTMRRATFALAETAENLSAMPRWIDRKAAVFNRSALVTVDIGPLPALRREPWVVLPQVLEGRKGARLALRAMRHTPVDVRMKIFGEGPDEPALRRRVEAMGLADRVEIIGKLPRDEALDMLRRAAAVVFTGLCEDGGCALSEAMQLGLPVVVLDHGGPKELLDRYCTDPSRVARVAPAGAADTAEALAEAITKFARSPVTDSANYFDRRKARDEFLGHLDRTVLGAEPSVPEPEKVSVAA